MLPWVAVVILTALFIVFLIENRNLNISINSLRSKYSLNLNLVYAYELAMNLELGIEDTRFFIQIVRLSLSKEDDYYKKLKEFLSSPDISTAANDAFTEYQETSHLRRIGRVDELGVRDANGNVNFYET